MAIRPSSKSKIKCCEQPSLESNNLVLASRNKLAWAETHRACLTQSALCWFIDRNIKHWVMEALGEHDLRGNELRINRNVRNYLLRRQTLFHAVNFYSHLNKLPWSSHEWAVENTIIKTSSNMTRQVQQAAESPCMLEVKESGHANVLYTHKRLKEEKG